jgi:hypothetical protein
MGYRGIPDLNLKAIYDPSRGGDFPDLSKIGDRRREGEERKRKDEYRNALTDYLGAEDPESKENAMTRMRGADPERSMQVEQHEKTTRANRTQHVLNLAKVTKQTLPQVTFKEYPQYRRWAIETLGVPSEFLPKAFSTEKGFQSWKAKALGQIDPAIKKIEKDQKEATLEHTKASTEKLQRPEKPTKWVPKTKKEAKEAAGWGKGGRGMSVSESLRTIKLITGKEVDYTALFMMPPEQQQAYMQRALQGTDVDPKSKDGQRLQRAWEVIDQEMERKLGMQEEAAGGGGIMPGGGSPASQDKSPEQIQGLYIRFRQQGMSPEEAQNAAMRQNAQ